MLDCFVPASLLVRRTLLDLCGGHYHTGSKKAKVIAWVSMKVDFGPGDNALPRFCKRNKISTKGQEVNHDSH